MIRPAGLHGANPKGLTPSHVEKAFQTLEAAGLRPPWPTDAWRQTAAQTWCALLFDVGPKEFATAVLTYLREQQRPEWPVPAMLLNCLEDEDALLGDDAWFAVLRVVQRVGTRYSTAEDRYKALNVPEHAKRCIEAALTACGGWAAIGQLNDKSLPVARSRFMLTYADAMRTLRRADRRRQVAGVAEALLQAPDAKGEPH